MTADWLANIGRIPGETARWHSQRYPVITRITGEDRQPVVSDERDLSADVGVRGPCGISVPVEHWRLLRWRRATSSRLHSLEKIEKADPVEQANNIVEFDDAEPPRHGKTKKGNGEEALEGHRCSPTAQQDKSGLGKPARLQKVTA